MRQLQLMSQNISERGAWNYLSLNTTVTLIGLNVVVRHGTSGDGRSQSHCTDLLQLHTERSKLHYPKDIIDLQKAAYLDLCVQPPAKKFTPRPPSGR